MVIDYSKWDKLELSDDSDVEVHPNVDKKSFIRWKQRDIHEKREVLKQTIKKLEASLEANKELAARLSRLIAAISKAISDDNEEMIQRYLSEVALCVLTAKGEARVARPASNPYAPTYNDMIDSLVEQIMSKIKETEDYDEDESKKNATEFVKQLKEHRDKLEELLVKEQKEYEDAVEERSKHIISDDLHTGFDSTLINKDVKEKKPATTTTTTTTTTQYETINSPSSSASSSQPAASKSSAQEEDNIDASPLALEFSKFKISDSEKAEKFLLSHPEICTEKEKDGLMIEAFNRGFENDDKGLEQVVYNSLILQYCASFVPTRGINGIRMFFERVIRDHGRAKEQFLQDVNYTVNHIKGRVSILSEEQRQSFASVGSESAGVEVVQLRSGNGSDDPTFTINIPPTDSQSPAVQEARALFESLRPELQEALKTKSLDEVNKVLENMTLQEGEEAVEIFELAGILNMDNKVYDEKDFEELLKQQKLQRLQEEEEEEGQVDEGQLADLELSGNNHHSTIDEMD